MKKRVLKILALAALLLIKGAGVRAQEVSPRVDSQIALTADEIIQKYIQARGGINKIEAIRTLLYRTRGDLDGDGEPEEFGMVRARPYYFLVGDPKTIATAGYAEGNDGSHWEFFRDQGLVLRTNGAPAAAIRHTAYFDDALVMSAREPGWNVELLGTKKIGETDTYNIKVTYPDGFETFQYVDSKTFLLTGNRISAPVHAFGNAVTSETRFSDWKPVNGVLYWRTLEEVDIATGKVLQSSTWNTIEANVEVSADLFSPPEYKKTPLNIMLNAAYAARNIPVNSLGWYKDFKNNPENEGVDTSLGMSSIGYQILKTGEVETAILLLEANVKDYPKVAHAHFGLGRAFMAAGRREEAIAAYRKALEVDPEYKRAQAALEEIVGR